MATYYIIRHADKERGDFFNPRLRHQDQPISAKGRQDAERLAAFFAGKQIAAIYVSGYQRTAQTIAPAAEVLGLVPTIDARLNEFDTGCIDGLTDAEVQQRFPETWSAYMQRTADFRFPEGETGAEAQARITDFLAEKRRQHGAGDLIVVAHDGLIRLLMCYVTGMPVYKRWRFRVDTCGIMEITHDPNFDAWILIRFNHTC